MVTAMIAPPRLDTNARVRTSSSSSSMGRFGLGGCSGFGRSRPTQHLAGAIGAADHINKTKNRATFRAPDTFACKADLRRHSEPMSSTTTSQAGMPGAACGLGCGRAWTVLPALDAGRAAAECRRLATHAHSQHSPRAKLSEAGFMVLLGYTASGGGAKRPRRT